jgi:hypothetical protein
MNSINVTLQRFAQKYLVLLALLVLGHMSYGSAGAGAGSDSDFSKDRKFLQEGFNQWKTRTDEIRSAKEIKYTEQELQTLENARQLLQEHQTERVIENQNTRNGSRVRFEVENERSRFHNDADSRVVEAQGLLRYQPRPAAQVPAPAQPVRQPAPVPVAGRAPAARPATQVRSNHLAQANFNTPVIAVQPANANDKADQLIKQSYISPGMQWGVLSIFDDPFFDIQTDTLQIGYIPTIDAIVAQTRLATTRQNVNQMMYALYTALQAIDLAIYCGDIEIYYQYFDTLWQSTGLQLPQGWKSLWLSKIVNNKGMEPALKDAFLAKRSLVQAEINRIKGGSWSAWLSSLTTTPTLTFEQKNQVRTRFQNNKLETTDITIIQRLVRANDYTTILPAAGQQPGQAQADLLVAQCFAAQNRPVNRDIINIYEPNAINQETINNQQGSLALYANFPSVEQLIADIQLLQRSIDQRGIVRQIVLTPVQKNYIRQFILNLREAINVALLIAQKNSSYFNYAAGAISNSWADPIVAKLLDYEKHLTDCFATFATDDDTNAEYWRSFIPQITVGKVVTVAAAATAFAFLFFDINYYRSDYITGDRFKSQVAIDEKQQVYENKEIEKQKTAINTSIKKQKDTIESLTKKRDQLLKTKEILPSANDRKTVEKEIAATNKQGQAAVTQLNKAIDDAIKFATQENTRLTQQFVKNPTPQLASSIEQNQQKIADLNQQKISTGEKTEVTPESATNLIDSVAHFTTSQNTSASQAQASRVTTTKPDRQTDQSLFANDDANTFSEYFDTAKYFVTSHPAETAVGTGAAALTGLGLKARSVWEKAAPATTPAPVDTAVKTTAVPSGAQNTPGQTDTTQFSQQSARGFKGANPVNGILTPLNSQEFMAPAPLHPRYTPSRFKTIAKGGLKGAALTGLATGIGVGGQYVIDNYGRNPDYVQDGLSTYDSLENLEKEAEMSLPTVQASSTGNIPPITNNITPPAAESSSNQ